MPALSPTMTQGNIGNWKKSVGDVIQPGDVLVEIETDKAQMEFECQEEGFLAKILLPEGTKEVPVGKPLAVLVYKKEDVEKFKSFTVKDKDTGGKNDVISTEKTGVAKSVAETPIQSPSTSTVLQRSQGDRIFASPLAKSTSKAMGIDLATVNGTGPRGRIIKEDVLLASKTLPNKTGYKDISLTTMRRVISRNG